MKRLIMIGSCCLLYVAAIAAQSFAQQQPTHTPATAPTTAPTTKAAPASTPTTGAPATPASPTTSASAIATKSLYERLGGEKEITAVVNDFVDRVAKDSKVNFTRHGTPKEWKATPENVTALKHNVTQYLCMATGGPQKYDGKDLKTAHQGMQITETEFNTMVADLSASLDHFKIAKPEHDELMKIVAGTKGQIVEQAATTPTIKPTSASTPTGSKK